MLSACSDTLRENGVDVSVASLYGTLFAFAKHQLVSINAGREKDPKKAKGKKKVAKDADMMEEELFADEADKEAEASQGVLRMRAILNLLALTAAR